MTSLCFLVDENTSHTVGDQLLRRQPDIELLTVGDERAPTLGTPDPQILIWLEENGYCLITRNRRSMPRHLRDHLATGRHIPGIFTLRPGASFGAMIEDLLMIWGASSPAEYQDQIVHVPL